MHVFGGCVSCYTLQTSTDETDVVVMHQSVGETPVKGHLGWFCFHFATDADSFALMDAVGYLYASSTYGPI